LFSPSSISLLFNNNVVHFQTRPTKATPTTKSTTKEPKKKKENKSKGLILKKFPRAYTQTRIFYLSIGKKKKKLLSTDEQTLLIILVFLCVSIAVFV